MNGLIVAMLVVVALTLSAGGSSLRPCPRDHTAPRLGRQRNAGGNGTNGTPADDATGDPVKGLIPRGTGNSLPTFGDGGLGT